MAQPDSNEGCVDPVSDRTALEDTSLAAKLADEAAYTLTNLVETQYVHKTHIISADGVYDCDCSGYVQYLLGQVALRHLNQIMDGITHTRPLADDFYDFFAQIPTTASNGWLQIATLTETKRGDMMAWKLPNLHTGDTGHIFVVFEPPTPVDDSTYAVKVYDSSPIRHFDDSRADGSQFHGGLGTGTLHITVDADGAPVGFQFNEKGSHHQAPTAIARILPFPAG